MIPPQTSYNKSSQLFINGFNQNNQFANRSINIHQRPLTGACFASLSELLKWITREKFTDCWFMLTDWQYQSRIEWQLHITDAIMTSWNVNIFHVTGPLCGDFTGDQWLPLTKTGNAEFDVFFDLRLNKRLSKQSWDWWFEMPSCPLWRHCNGKGRQLIFNKNHTSQKLVPVPFTKMKCRLRKYI